VLGQHDITRCFLKNTNGSVRTEYNAFFLVVSYVTNGGAHIHIHIYISLIDPRRFNRVLGCQ